MNKLMIILLIGLIFISGCLYQEVKTEDEGKLSELQITACNAADEGNTCDTKLEKLELVTKEECCSYLGKCCD